MIIKPLREVRDFFTPISTRPIAPLLSPPTHLPPFLLTPTSALPYTCKSIISHNAQPTRMLALWTPRPLHANKAR
jgi:hypothetical protein